MRALLLFSAGFIFIMALTYGRELLLLAVGPVFLALRLSPSRREQIAQESTARGMKVDEQLSKHSLEEQDLRSVEAEKRREVEEWLDR